VSGTCLRRSAGHSTGGRPRRPARATLPGTEPIINLDEVTFEHHTHGDKFEARDGPISERLGAKQLGYSIAVVPPGRKGGDVRRGRLVAVGRAIFGKNGLAEAS
jgi:hypothetical protein